MPTLGVILNLHQTAILEPDAKKIGHRIWLAQTAIINRLKALFKTASDAAEKLAMNNALHVLEVLNQIYGSAVERSSRLVALRKKPTSRP